MIQAHQPENQSVHADEQRPGENISPHESADNLRQFGI